MSHLRPITLFIYSLMVYGIVLLSLSPINLLSFDTYYYWEWSRHLALSYYDGSPMIAYFIRASTTLFGDTLFALNMVAILSSALTAYLLYKTARLFLSKEASTVAVCLWLFCPFITIDMLKQTTYDTPLMLFWALTLYYATGYLKKQTPSYLYAIGISIGLMLLSKYSGIVLVAALGIFLISTPYRTLFKTRHLYGALLLALILFSPVLIWNQQHGWQSFYYQLTTHQLQTDHHPFWGLFSGLFLVIIPSLNIMILPPILCWIHRKKNNPQPIFVSLFQVVGTTFLCFYILIATQATLRSNWLAPYILTSALLGGYLYDLLGYKKSTRLVILCNACISLVILVSSTTLYQLAPSKNTIYYRLISAWNITHYPYPMPIVTTGWFEARPLFFLKNKPPVYTLPCGSPENQYGLWSTSIKDDILHHRLQQVLFIDPENRVDCALTYFKQCTRIPTPIEHTPQKDYVLYAYQCNN